MKKKDYTVTIIVIVGLFILIMMLLVAITPERSQPSPTVTVTRKPASTAPILYNGRAHIETIDQNIAGKVVILSSALKENGYVVIHKEEKGKPGKIIGISTLLSPGLYSNRWVNLTEGVVPGEMLVAMLHTDNGDGFFDVKNDTPIKGDKMMMGGSGMIEFMAI